MCPAQCSTCGDRAAHAPALLLRTALPRFQEASGHSPRPAPNLQGCACSPTHFPGGGLEVDRAPPGGEGALHAQGKAALRLHLLLLGETWRGSGSRGPVRMQGAGRGHLGMQSRGTALACHKEVNPRLLQGGLGLQGAKAANATPLECPKCCCFPSSAAGQAPPSAPQFPEVKRKKGTNQRRKREEESGRLDCQGGATLAYHSPVLLTSSSAVWGWRQGGVQEAEPPPPSA